MVLLAILFLVSGAAGLVYELVWTRELVFVFGGTTYAITTVLVAFMGGLGFGSWAAGRLTARLRRPGAVYAVLELFIGLYALAVPVLLGLAEPLYKLCYPHVAGTPWLLNAARFCVGAAVLVLPTIAMGATLPVLVRYATLGGGRIGRSVGLLYGINTMGAACGTLACGFWLIPHLGLTTTTRLAAVGNVTIGVLALLLLRRRAGMADGAGRPVAEESADVADGTDVAARAPRGRAGDESAGETPAAPFGRGDESAGETPAPPLGRGDESAGETPAAPLGRGDESAGETPAPPLQGSTPSPDDGRRAGVLRRWVLITCATSGFVAMAYQIAWTRALVMAFGSSTYSFTCILSAFILGLALGSLAAARFVDRWVHPVIAVGYAQLGIGLSAALVLPLVGWIPVLVFGLVERYAADFNTLIGWQFLLVIAVTLVPTLLLGMLFPLFARLVALSGDDPGSAAGRIYGVNTIGTILGSFLAGFVLIPLIGAHALILTGTLINGLLGVWLLHIGRPRGVRAATGGRPGEARAATEGRPRGARAATEGSLGGRRGLTPAVAVGLAVLAVIPAIGLTVGRWDPYLLSSGPFIKGFDPRRLAQRVDLIYYREGVDLTAAVTRAKADPGLLSLRVNAKTDASTALADMNTQLMLGHLPLLLCDDPRRVCVIGLGSGMTLGAVTEHETPQVIDSIEISEAVVDAARLFAPYNNNALADPRVRSIRADGRNHLLLADQQYDVIISVPSNPWIAGVANLFTREYFELCRRALRPGGRLAFWMQGYMFRIDDFKLVTRTALASFPHVTLWELGFADYLLVASDAPFDVSLADFTRRYRQPNVLADLYRAGLGRPVRMLGRFIADQDTLRAWAGTGVIHTDDNALLEFSAARAMFAARTNELGRALQALAQRPFGRVVRADTRDPSARRVIERVERIGAARAALFEMLAAGPQDPHEIARRLLDIYATDPGDVRVYQALLDVREVLRSEGGGQPDAGTRELLRRIHALRAPSVAPRTAQTLDDVSAALMDLANAAGAEGRWATAADYLEEARGLTPNNLRILINDAVALMNSGRAEQAVRVLERAVAAGVIKPSDLAASHTFAPLRERADFRRLIGAEAP